jgi:hypothetical protein
MLRLQASGRKPGTETGTRLDNNYSRPRFRLAFFPFYAGLLPGRALGSQAAVTAAENDNAARTLVERRSRQKDPAGP